MAEAQVSDGFQAEDQDNGSCHSDDSGNAVPEEKGEMGRVWSKIDKLEFMITKMAGNVEHLSDFMKYMGENESTTSELDLNSGFIAEDEGQTETVVGLDVSVSGSASEAGQDSGSVKAATGTGTENSVNKESEDGASCSSSVFKDRLKHYSKSEPTSEKIDSDFAALLNKMVTNLAEPDSFKTLSDKYVRPENTEFLVCPKVNSEIWEVLPEFSKIQDRSLQGIQKNVVKSLFPLVEAMGKTEDPGVKELLLDSLTLLGNVSMQFNMHRRNNMKNSLEKAKPLANKDIPVTTLLFGDDVEGEVKKLETKTKLKESMKKTSSATGGFVQRTGSFGQKPRTSYGQHYNNYKKKPVFDKFRKNYNAFLGQGGQGRQETRGNLLPKNKQQFQGPSSAKYRKTQHR